MIRERVEAGLDEDRRKQVSGRGLPVGTRDGHQTVLQIGSEFLEQVGRDRAGYQPWERGPAAAAEALRCGARTAARNQRDAATPGGSHQFA